MASPAAVSLMVHALKMLSIRPRTCFELRTRLVELCSRRKKSLRARTAEGFADVDCTVVAQQTIDELIADGRLDDEAYAAWHAAQRAMNRPRSRIVLRAELMQRGITAPLAVSECARVDETAAALDIARRKRSLADDALFKFLIRRGYPVKTAQAAVKGRHAGAADPSGEPRDED